MLVTILNSFDDEQNFSSERKLFFCSFILTGPCPCLFLPEQPLTSPQWSTGGLLPRDGSILNFFPPKFGYRFINLYTGTPSSSLPLPSSHMPRYLCLFHPFLLTHRHPRPSDVMPTKNTAQYFLHDWFGQSFNCSSRYHLLVAPLSVKTHRQSCPPRTQPLSVLTVLPSFAIHRYSTSCTIGSFNHSIALVIITCLFHLCNS